MAVQARGGVAVGAQMLQNYQPALRCNVELLWSFGMVTTNRPDHDCAFFDVDPLGGVSDQDEKSAKLKALANILGWRSKTKSFIMRSSPAIVDPVLWQSLRLASASMPELERAVTTAAKRQQRMATSVSAPAPAPMDERHERVPIVSALNELRVHRMLAATISDSIAAFTSRVRDPDVEAAAERRAMTRVTAAAEKMGRERRERGREGGMQLLGLGSEGLSAADLLFWVKSGERRALEAVQENLQDQWWHFAINEGVPTALPYVIVLAGAAALAFYREDVSGWFASPSTSVPAPYAQPPLRKPPKRALNRRRRHQ